MLSSQKEVPVSSCPSSFSIVCAQSKKQNQQTPRQRRTSGYNTYVALATLTKYPSDRKYPQLRTPGFQTSNRREGRSTPLVRATPQGSLLRVGRVTRYSRVRAHGNRVLLAPTRARSVALSANHRSVSTPSYPRTTA
eukprot:1157667-Pyramimonas_sp.AAC.1